jgi:hypothetical protein
MVYLNHLLALYDFYQFIIINDSFFILKGKSLSLICGSLRWLFDEIQSWRDEYEELSKPIETKNESKYMNDIYISLILYLILFSSGDWLKRLMKRKEEETAREKRRVYFKKFFYMNTIVL